MTSLQERLLAAFQVEYREHLQAVRAMLEDRAHGGATGTFDFVEAYRRVHSLKGAARAVGLRPLEMLAHALETLMSQCQSGAVALDLEVTVVIYGAFDGIEDFMAELEVTPDPREPVEARAAVERLLGGRGGPAGGDVSDVSDEGVPAADHVPDMAPRRGALARTAETARVDVDSLDAVLKHAGQILTEDLRQERIAAELRRLRKDLEATIAAGATNSDALAAILDRAKAIGQLQGHAAWQLRRLGRQLFRDVHALRIVPADGVFGGVRKMVRDLAQAEDKQIEVVLAGLDTRADRHVLQTLKDPVMHLLRNAVTHGIEAPEARTQRGKSAIGRIVFTISTQRNRLLIRIEDDGHGLDPARIVREAARRGMLPEGGAAADDVTKLMPLLLQPGFTTVREVTEIAGRGMGLSVVDKAVRQLQGSFDLSPAGTAGTAATIVVPLAVASSRLLLVECKSQTYGIPAHSIQRLHRLAAADVTTLTGEPMIMLGGDDAAMPLASLAQLLRNANAAVAGDGEAIPVVLLTSGRNRLAIAVDAFVAVQDCVIHDLDAAVPNPDLVIGGVILPDGSVSTVLNPTALIRAAAETRRQLSFEARQPTKGNTVPKILVVDDSITTRTLEKSILEARGFRVRVGVDGIDALDKLRQERADLVIADIEMPRMDGFELLHVMKGDQHLASIPVILVTSRDDAQDRRKGLALGAQAYIVKQRFNQRALLETIDQIL